MNARRLRKFRRTYRRTIAKPLVCIFGILACLLTGLPVRAQSADAKNDAPARVIEISAKKYEFSPSEIRVKMGEMIQLKVHSVDEPHVVKIDVYPEGSKDKSTAGLKFGQPEQNGKVEKNVDQVLEFVAIKGRRVRIQVRETVRDGPRADEGEIDRRIGAAAPVELLVLRVGEPDDPRAARILLLPCCGNILLFRSEAGRTMSGREPTFLLGRLQCS